MSTARWMPSRLIAIGLLALLAWLPLPACSERSAKPSAAPEASAAAAKAAEEKTTAEAKAVGKTPAISAASDPNAVVAAPVRPFRYEVAFETSGAVALELRINGAVVLDESEANTAYGSRRISSWVRARRNVLDARLLAAKPGPKGAPRTDPTLELKIEKVLPESRQVITLTELSWPVERPASLPAVLRLEFSTGGDVPACKLFAEAEPLDDSEQTRGQVAAFARELHGAYATRDLAKLTEMRAYYAADEEQCRGASAAGAAQGVQAFIEHVREQRRWQVDPLAANDPQLELLPELRVYRVSRAGDPLIHVKQDDSEALADVFVARIGGQLTWVR
ncbi:MAG TPA: hypothetical protein VK509_10570 [Polyangiales bacterium]|nr:hypothetical protein [Polyangiales bacterium]